MTSVVLVVAAVWVLTHPRPPARPGDPGDDGPGRTGSGTRAVSDLAVVCDLMCAALTAGASLPRACEAVGQAIGTVHGGAMVRASKALRLGATWEQAWDDHVFGTVLAPAWSDGADPTPLMNQLARSIRAGRAAAAKTAAARLSVKLVLPVGLCLLPAFILVGVVPLLISGSLKILQ